MKRQSLDAIQLDLKTIMYKIQHGQNMLRISDRFSSMSLYYILWSTVQRFKTKSFHHLALKIYRGEIDVDNSVVKDLTDLLIDYDTTLRLRYSEIAQLFLAMRGILDEDMEYFVDNYIHEDERADFIAGFVIHQAKDGIVIPHIPDDSDTQISLHQKMRDWKRHMEEEQKNYRLFISLHQLEKTR